MWYPRKSFIANEEKFKQNPFVNISSKKLTPQLVIILLYLTFKTKSVFKNFSIVTIVCKSLDEGPFLLMSIRIKVNPDADVSTTFYF